MRQALAVFVGVVFGFAGLIVGVFVGGYFFADSNALQITCGVVGALLFGVGTYFYRRDKEQCKKCGALWSVKHASTETLHQNVVSETKKVGSETVFIRDSRGRPTGVDTPRPIYETKNYLVGEEKLIYRCEKCGNETSGTRKFKKLA